MPSVPDVLAKVFVCVPFFWNVHKLPTLRSVTEAIDGWPTEVAVRIISNKPERLAGTLESWNTSPSFEAVVGPANHTHPFELTWAHRNYMLDALQTGGYTAFVYLEDDIPMHWHTLLSWAHDNEALEPRGLQRQFYRTEIAPWNGRPYMTDARGYTSLDKAMSVSRTVHLETPTISGHTDFVVLSDPYSAMYVASAAVMHKFAASPQWTDRNSPWSSWGAEAGGEMAANAIIFLDPPLGFWSAGLVSALSKHDNLQCNDSKPRRA
ncbi:hypothetical protein WJX84_001197 [Apatococcus fuscideae]|uniref:Uncharacterized protein n=1 Tax=Apatococcus fuscideae TaxID=2026836 RepID=A0AAW1SY11_9CHLO